MTSSTNSVTDLLIPSSVKNSLKQFLLPMYELKRTAISKAAKIVAQTVLGKILRKTQVLMGIFPLTSLITPVNLARAKGVEKSIAEKCFRKLVKGRRIRRA